MKAHTKIYMDYFDYLECDNIFCELCGNIGVDIHHIEARGMGGSKLKDKIENLICLCRNCHENAHYQSLKERYSKENLKKVHLMNIKKLHF